MEKQVQELLDAGQSVWIDYLRRSMFASGELARLIDRGVRGMTSNPTIFEKAIGAGNDYDKQLATLIGSEKNADALFWDLAVADIQSACDAFAPVHASSKGNDGFVSLEVSPLLANDTAGTIAMVEELWKRVNRPERDDQDSRHQRRAPGDRRVDLPWIQHQRHAGVLHRDVRARRDGPTSRVWNAAWPRASRSTRFVRSTRSS